MMSQHMRFTAGAMLPTGDFLAHVGDWTGLPPAELLGLHAWLGLACPPAGRPSSSG